MKDIKVLIASDSFKGSATSMGVANALEKGILKVNNEIDFIKYSIADGGEGTLETIIDQTGGNYVELEVLGPLDKKVMARYGVLGEKVFIEMAQCSGLGLISSQERNPLITHTFGVGELINHALNKGYKDIYVGLGGSATNDGGMGMAKALGVKFLDESSKELDLGVVNLDKLFDIDISNINPRIKDASFTILSDVTNPLCGLNGASHIFAPQKGADTKMVIQLDALLEKYKILVESLYKKDYSSLAGSGAAGGLGFGLLAFCSGKIVSGIDAVVNLIELEKNMKDIDLVITGEGNMDSQSIQGKAPIGIAKLAKKYNKPVVAVVGGRSDDLKAIYENGVDLVIDIVNKPMSLDFAMENSIKLIELAGESAIRAYYLGK